MSCSRTQCSEGGGGMGWGREGRSGTCYTFFYLLLQHGHAKQILLGKSVADSKK